MAGKQDNLTPFDSDSAKAAAIKSAEVRNHRGKLKPKTVKISAVHEREIIKRSLNLSEFLRRKLDEEFGL